MKSVFLQHQLIHLNLFIGTNFKYILINAFEQFSMTIKQWTRERINFVLTGIASLTTLQPYLFKGLLLINRPPALSHSALK